MIAPIKPTNYKASPPPRGTSMRKARRWIVQSLLSRRDQNNSPEMHISPRAAWLAAAWLLLVAGAFVVATVLTRFGS